MQSVTTCWYQEPMETAESAKYFWQVLACSAFSASPHALKAPAGPCEWRQSSFNRLVHWSNDCSCWNKTRAWKRRIKLYRWWIDQKPVAFPVPQQFLSELPLLSKFCSMQPHVHAQVPVALSQPAHKIWTWIVQVNLVGWAENLHLQVHQNPVHSTLAFAHAHASWSKETTGLEWFCFFPFWICFWISCSNHFPYYLHHFEPGSCYFHGIRHICDFEPFLIHSVRIKFLESAAFWRWKLLVQRPWFLHDCSTVFVDCSTAFIHVYLVFISFFWSLDWSLERCIVHAWLIMTIICKCIFVYLQKHFMYIYIYIYAGFCLVFI